VMEDDSKEENIGSEDDNFEVFRNEKASVTTDVSLKRSYLQRHLCPIQYTVCTVLYRSHAVRHVELIGYFVGHTFRTPNTLLRISSLKQKCIVIISHAVQL